MTKNICELCIRGDLYFFENSFSNQELIQIKAIVESFNPAEYFDIRKFEQEVQAKLNQQILMLNVNHVIAV